MTERALVVDLGGVVCEFDHQRRLATFAAASGRSTRQVHALLWESGFSADCDRGRYTAEEAYSYIRRTLDLDRSRSELRALWMSAYHPNRYVLKLLATIGPDIMTALLTDNGPVEEDGVRSMYPQVRDALDWLLFSYRLGGSKPDSALFDAAAATLGHSPDSIVLVDDAPANVVGAKAAGWHAIYYRQPEDLSVAITWARGSDGLPGRVR